MSMEAVHTDWSDSFSNNPRTDGQKKPITGLLRLTVTIKRQTDQSTERV